MSDFWKTARHRWESLLGKTNKAIETGRIQIEITQFKNRINSTYREIGKYIHKQSDKGIVKFTTDNEFISQKLKDIQFYNEKIEELRAQSPRWSKKQNKEREEEPADY
ncbi:hypothetical protein [Flexithrix dorotheae]|uniref:hypothetical protein n=1 Tax=Flexithrix dorotheae TaxID=70993 RepID=UPI00039D1D11|nr:hypothetical protein [Flexithrix dorotheae]